MRLQNTTTAEDDAVNNAASTIETLTSAIERLDDELTDALKKAEELESENADLKAQVEELKDRLTC